MSSNGSVALTPQQRAFLVEATKHRWISASMFAGAGKIEQPQGPKRAITRNSAYKVMARLEARGLLGRYSEHNRELFAITEAGRRAL